MHDIDSTYNEPNAKKKHMRNPQQTNKQMLVHDFMNAGRACNGITLWICNSFVRYLLKKGQIHVVNEHDIT